MRLNIAVPEEHVKKPVLDAALESVTRLNEEMLKAGKVPTFEQGAHGIQWQPEPPGAEHFDHAAKVLGRGHGDCDDLAPWHAASLRVTGKDPGAQAVVKRVADDRWHALVKRSDGSYDDPSLTAGMPGKRRPGVRAPVLAPMSASVGHSVSGELVQMPQLAARPIFTLDGEIEAWDARADIPWIHSPSDFGQDAAMATLHRAPVASQAVVGALIHGCDLAELSGVVDDEVINRADAIREYIQGLEDGADEQEIVSYISGVYGPEHAMAAHVVGAGFFKKLGRMVKKAALPILKKTVQFIPGVGPVVSTALDVAEAGVKEAIKAGKKRKAARAFPPVVTSDMTVTHNGRVYVCQSR